MTWLSKLFSWLRGVRPAASQPEEAASPPLREFARRGRYWVAGLAPWWYVLRDEPASAEWPDGYAPLGRFALPSSAVARMDELAAGRDGESV